MFFKFKKIIDNIKYIKQDIDLTNKTIQIKKDTFNKGWNKWGTKNSHARKIP